MQEKIWHEFIDKRFGDEYLSRYISRQTDIRKWFKIVTLLLSGGGIWTAFKNLTIPTVISLSAIALVQVATLIENFIIHSEKQIEDLGKLRMLYYEQWNKLEELYLTYGNHTEQEATNKFFQLRNNAKAMEELDNKLNIKKKKGLMLSAENNNRAYLKSHYNV